MTNERFNRQVQFFGTEGQVKLAGRSVAVIGIGGLGTHIVQQLAHLGVGHLTLVDNEELDETNLNRYVGARINDPIPGTPKVEIGERIIREINPDICIEKIQAFLQNDLAFDAVINADTVFGCLDNDGARLILNELCAAYCRPYYDLASEIHDHRDFGGRVFIARDGQGCLYCYNQLDIGEVQNYLMDPKERLNREAIYGLDRNMLGSVGPSVISINGTVASLAITEFIADVTGLRQPKRCLMYRGHMGIVSVVGERERRIHDCYYCSSIWGKGDAVDIQRYLRTEDLSVN